MVMVYPIVLYTIVVNPIVRGMPNLVCPMQF